jgi:hypothetical protein
MENSCNLRMANPDLIPDCPVCINFLIVREFLYRFVSIRDGLETSSENVSDGAVFKMIAIPIYGILFPRAKRRVVVRQMGCFIWHYDFLFELRLQRIGSASRGG